MRLLQYLTMVLMSLYGHRDLVKRASSAVKHDNLELSILSSFLFSGVARPGERNRADSLGAWRRRVA